jgi:hypothetical protein
VSAPSLHHQLEQEYRAGFIMYESTYKGVVAELKLCELHGGWFSRVAKLEKSVEVINGKNVVLLRKVGTTVCDRCAEKLARLGHNLADFRRAEEPFRQISEEVKEARLRYRRVGAPHIRVVGRAKEHVRKTRGRVSWVQPLADAFKMQGKLTKKEIGAVIGSKHASVIAQVRKVGFVLVVVDKLHTGHRPQNVYALAD